jgi:hypothetical protein
VSIFKIHSSPSETKPENDKQWYARLDDVQKKKLEYQRKNVRSESCKKTQAERKKHKKTNFPPSPPSKALYETVVRGWCEDMSPEVFMEGDCAVCGQLTPLSQLSELSRSECNLDVLIRDGLGITCLERFSPNDPIQEIKGPVLNTSCTKICCSCKGCLDEYISPKYTLANGLWLGQVPLQLQNLSYAEQLLISHVCRNKCLVKVSSGMHKMKANVIALKSYV